MGYSTEERPTSVRVSEYQVMKLIRETETRNFTAALRSVMDFRWLPATDELFDLLREDGLDPDRLDNEMLVGLIVSKLSALKVYKEIEASENNPPPL